MESQWQVRVYLSSGEHRDMAASQGTAEFAGQALAWLMSSPYEGWIETAQSTMINPAHIVEAAVVPVG